MFLFLIPISSCIRRSMVNCIFILYTCHVDTHDDSNKNLEETNTLYIAQVLEGHNENFDNVDHTDIENESISIGNHAMASTIKD